MDNRSLDDTSTSYRKRMILTDHPLLLDAASTPPSSAVRYGVVSKRDGKEWY
jgi:hypothetical protein